MRTFFLWFFLIILLQPCSGQNPAESPNVILFLVDDLGWRDLGWMGSRFYQTPNIDELASRGVLFTDAYSNAPNCAPSRASLLTGLYPPRHGIFTVNSAERGKAVNRRLIPVTNQTELDTTFSTLGEVFQQSGYATAHLGKWHLGEGTTGPKNQGFDVNIGGDHRGHPPTYFSPYQNKSLEDGPEGEYLTDRLTDEAIGFIEKNKDNPFFLYLSHYAVHTPIQAKPEMEKKFEKVDPDNGQDNAAYAAMIESTDESLGRLVEKLQELDLDEETIIVFFSDNGGHGAITSNKPLKGAKGMLYEGGIRVPLIIHAPGVQEEAFTSSEPVIGTDLFPTLLDLAGIPHEKFPTDGISLLPVLEGQKDLERQYLYWHFPAYLEGYRGTKYPDELVRGWRAVPSGAIRQGNWKLIQDFETDEIELYNLKEDPRESKDLSGRHPEKAKELLQQLEEWREKTKASVPVTTNPVYEGE